MDCGYFWGKTWSLIAGNNLSLLSRAGNDYFEKAFEFSEQPLIFCF